MIPPNPWDAGYKPPTPAEIFNEAGDSTPRDPHGSMLCCGGTDYHDAGCPVPRLEARVVELEAAGEALADAIHALDSYAASSQVAPLERSERAVKALDQWAALAAAGEGEE
jgi:hypothetical protein